MLTFPSVIKMTDYEVFELRHRTIRRGFYYPPGYEPTSLLNGKIAFWMSGSTGLTSASSPKDVTACYHVYIQGDPTLTYKYEDKKYGIYWPRPDEDYKIFSLEEDQNPEPSSTDKSTLKAKPNANQSKNVQPKKDDKVESEPPVETPSEAPQIQPSFKYRYETVRGEFYYPPGYEPAEYDGVISAWMTGAQGLTRLSAPKPVTAVYVAGSTGRTSKHIYYDETTRLYWPRPDEDYIQFSPNVRVYIV